MKAALELNAASVILAQNHPSGVGEPGGADELLTRTLRQALGLVDIRIQEHLVMAGGQVVSFGERGLV